VPTPVVWLAPRDHPPTPQGTTCVRPAAEDQGPLLCHPRFPEDVAVIREVLDRLEGGLDLAEPLRRIREAIGEARKMGVTKSA
jgi:hypothetical protein